MLAEGAPAVGLSGALASIDGVRQKRAAACNVAARALYARSTAIGGTASAARGTWVVVKRVLIIRIQLPSINATAFKILYPVHVLYIVQYQISGINSVFYSHNPVTNVCYFLDAFELLT